MMFDYGYAPVGGFGFLLMVAFWILVVSGIAILLRWMVGKTKGDDEKSPLEILKERYAKGDIDKKEFEAIKKDIVKS